MTLERMRSTSTFEVGDGSHRASSYEETESTSAATNGQSPSYETGGNDDFQNRKRKLLDDLTRAENFKAKGNADLMRGKILVGHTAGNDLLASACKMYAQAVALVPLDVPVDLYGAECEKRKKMLHVSVLLNLALASICCKDWDTVLNCTKTVLEIDPKNTKALYRSARACFELSEHESARQYIFKAKEYAPKNKDVHKLYIKVQEAWRKSVRASLYRREMHEGVCHSIYVLLERAQLSLEAPPLRFGNCTDAYAWGQSETNVHVYIPFASGLPTNCISCRFSRKFLDITFSRHPTSSARSALLSTHRFAGGLYSTIIVDEGTWMVEVSGLLHIELVKEKNEEPEWWPCIFADDQEENRIDTSQFDLSDSEDEMSFATALAESVHGKDAVRVINGDGLVGDLNAT